MKFDLFRKEEVLKFFRKVDGRDVGLTRNGRSCPLYTYITSPEGLGIVDESVFVGVNDITIGNTVYNTVKYDGPESEKTWVHEFVCTIDEQYKTPYNGMVITGDQAADVLESIPEE